MVQYEINNSDKLTIIENYIKQLETNKLDSDFYFVIVDTEGHLLSQKYYPFTSVIQLSFLFKTVFLLDVLSLPFERLKKCLTDLFAINHLMKVFFDCRNDLVVFWKSWGIKMNNVIDLQIVHMYNHNYFDYRTSLVNCLNIYNVTMNFPEKQKVKQQHFKKLHHLWFYRPLPKILKTYSLKDVEAIKQLFYCFIRKYPVQEMLKFTNEKLKSENNKLILIN